MATIHGTRISAGKPTVICLHSSGGTGAQWKALAARLQPEFAALAPDLHGHGSGPVWRGAAADIVAADAARIASLAADAPGDVHLVGHSYGAVIALRVALQHPESVASVAVYEPVAMRILFDYNRRHRATAEVRELARDVERALDGGCFERAAQRFFDYWAGSGHWDGLAPERQAAFAQRMPVIRSHFESLIGDAAQLRDYAALDAPVLVLAGRDTRASTRRIAELLEYALPDVEFDLLPGMGHLGPITHADAVAQRIARFVRRHADARIVHERMAA